MRLVEQHRIRPADPRFVTIDQAAFASKNLYNKALYATRQAFFQTGAFPSYPALYHAMKGEPEYAALPRKVAQWVLKQVCAAWDSYRQALAAYAANPAAFVGRPRIPRYLGKQGRNLLVYTTQALSRPGWRSGCIEPSGLGISVPTQQAPQRIQQVRIVPRAGFYVVEVIYERDPVPIAGNPALFASVDVGVNVLAALTSNQQGFVPRLVNGRPIKSLNQFYNKRRAQLQQALGHPGTTKRLARLANRRNDRIHHYMHTTSRRIINLLVAEGIGTLVLGKNPLWKQEASLGRVNNQHFVQLPHARFLDLLTYKAQLVGIQVVTQEESYTSKASFLDGDPLPVYGAGDATARLPTFSGQRVQRGLYRASGGRRIHADVNGAYNLGRKAFPDSFGQGIEAVVVRPARLAV
jgi:putative transposase